MTHHFPRPVHPNRPTYHGANLMHETVRQIHFLGGYTRTGLLRALPTLHVLIMILPFKWFESIVLVRTNCTGSDQLCRPETKPVIAAIVAYDVV